MPGKGLVWLFEKHLLGRRPQSYANSLAVYTPHCPLSIGICYSAFSTYQKASCVTYQESSNSISCSHNPNQIFKKPVMATLLESELILTCLSGAVSVGKGSHWKQSWIPIIKAVLYFAPSAAVEAPKQLLWMGQKSLKKGGTVYIHTNLAFYPWRKLWGIAVLLRY